MKVNTLTLNDDTIPATLKEIPGAPEVLYVAGNNLDLLHSPAIAIVGSRKLTVYGRQVTYDFAYQLARWGFVIVSGLAYGIDAIAHQAALDAGGATIAVLPSGLGRIYPSAHHHLAEKIVLSGGLLLSEYADDAPPQKHQFIARNRLVSGLTRGVLITEAAEKSGTLHTANFALEQGREVFAIPGNINWPNAKGTNNLIKTGANVVTEPKDILDVLGIEAPNQNHELLANSQEEHTILVLIKNGVRDAGELFFQSQLPIEQFNQTLTLLEISGRIKSAGGQWVLL